MLSIERERDSVSPAGSVRVCIFMAERERFVLDFCPTFRILFFCYVGQKSSVTVHKTTHRVVLFTAFESLGYSPSKKRLAKNPQVFFGTA